MVLIVSSTVAAVVLRLLLVGTLFNIHLLLANAATLLLVGG